MNQISKPVSVKEMTAPIQMASGRVVDLANLQAADIHWPDLVENLVKIPRFNGATSHVTYTVAQHCCLMYDRAEDQYKPWALLRDFHAGFFGEPTWPMLWFAALKTDCADTFMDAIDEAKGELTDAIWQAAGLQEGDDDSAILHRLNYLNLVDKMLTASERRDLMNGAALDHWPLPTPFPTAVKAWGQDKAREQLELRLKFIGIRTRG
ncbi:MAG: hypothetical protein K5905_19040 [Roseibium sp.]|uniref:hypothetical protein n=1 Tax=Roseibium sp. TaxID=1936156 RepID=UPI0026068B0A|nr:hypothetical protein [Roseibium sp.]MCV0427560.1 hypothetical protein [Roseibium sp.]